MAAERMSNFIGVVDKIAGETNDGYSVLSGKYGLTS
jgi:hypothetical protein